MFTLPNILRIFAAVLIAVAALRMMMGVQADALLGAILPTGTVAEPSLENQTRFYGGLVVLYGVLLWMCASDLRRYETVFKIVLACFAFGVLGRLIAMAMFGLPSMLVLGLLAVEVIALPVLWFWFEKERKIFS